MTRIFGVLYRLCAAPMVVSVHGQHAHPKCAVPVLGVVKLLGIIGLLVTRFPSTRKGVDAGLNFDLALALLSRSLRHDGLNNNRIRSSSVLRREFPTRGVDCCSRSRFPAATPAAELLFHSSLLT